MQLKKILNSLLGAMILFSAISVSAQENGLSAYSLYTFYGIGDIATQGPTYLRSMGGASVAFRSPNMLNYTNPAAYSAVARNTFLFNVGLEQQNYYVKSADKSTAFNTFNLRNIAFEFPVAAKMGVGISIAPYSDVGYRLSVEDTDPNVVGNIGNVNYRYYGEGGLSQIKAGFGWEIFNNFSIGAHLVFYRGYISRVFSTTINNITGVPYYYNASGEQNEEISSLFGEFGVQYMMIDNTQTKFTIGATYHPGGKMHNKSYRYMPSSSMENDTLIYSTYNMGFELPTTWSVGLNFKKRRYMLAADYEFKDWGKRNKDDVTEQREFRDTNSFKVGGEYTPSAGDVRSFLKRLTYRAGFRYSDYYMRIYGQDINEKVITLGVGIPMRNTNLSNLNLGVEMGQRGQTSHGLYKDTFVKFSVGMNFFGEDYWFVKFKYD